MNLISWIAAALSGWLLGILVNYLADVLPVSRRLSKPICYHCGVDLNPFQHAFLLKRCPQCTKPKPTRVWLVQVFMVGISLLLIFHKTLPLSFWWAIILIAYLLLVTVIDIEHHLILHATSVFGSLLCLGIGIWLHGTGATIKGGLAGFGIMLGIYLFGIGFIRLIQKLKPRQMMEQEAIGFGDVILNGVMGLLLGWPVITIGIMLSVVIGGAVSLVVLVWNGVNKSYHPDLAVPYGPFLTISAFILLIIRVWLY